MSAILWLALVGAAVFLVAFIVFAFLICFIELAALALRRRFSATLKTMGRKAAMWTAIALPLAGLGWLVYVDYSLKAGFHKVDVGQSQDRVESILGAPDGLEECGYFGRTVGREIPSSCVKEHSYLSLLSLTDVWTVGFDDTKRVVWKYRYRSP